jgi:hypothetical protein
MILASIDVHALLKVLYTSLIAGAGVTTVFAVVVLGVVRSIDLHREGRSTGGVAYAALAGAGLVVVAAAIVYGLILLGHK